MNKNFSKLTKLNRKNLYLKILLSKALITLSIILAITPTTSHAMPFFSKNKLPTTPYALQIDISKKGNKAEVDLRIKSDKERKRLEPKIVAFELRFVPYDPEDDPKSKYYISSFRKNLIMVGALRKYFEPQRTKEESKEVFKDYNHVLSLMDREELISSGAGSSYKSEWVQRKGVLIPNIRLIIINLSDPDKKVVYDEVLEVKKHPNKGGHFIYFLDNLNLSMGSYKIVFENQSDAPEFQGTKVLLSIGSYRSKY